MGQNELQSGLERGQRQFSAERYPWFGDGYIMPDEIERQFDRSALRDYSNRFVDRG